MTGPVDPTVIDPIPVRILIVADGRLRFDSEDYSLSLMIEALHQQASPIVRFSITTAYRMSKNPTSDDSNGAGADRPAFTFENGRAQDHYDEIWFFGDQQEVIGNGAPSPQTTQLSPQELATVTGFMDDGGGVFATGDHESRGASIGAHLPRIRGMRTWHNGPGSDKGPTQNNTIPPGNSESTSTPQHVSNAIYKAGAFAPYPHPLLDCPRGMIEVLPDHFHEGTCDPMPPDTIPGDFPASRGAVALGITESTRNFPPGSGKDQFSAIRAYDGHLANVGRIVVDASFHHFVSQNLRGFPRTLPPGKAGGELLGFKTGADALADIRSYYKNIAIWLAPPERQTSLFIRGLWEVRWRSHVSGMLPPATRAIDAREILAEPDRATIVQVGAEARNALNLFTSRACSLLWALETFNQFSEAAVFLQNIYPWLPENELKILKLNSDIDENAVTVMIGAAVIAMAARFPEKPRSMIENLDEKLKAAVTEGIETAVTILKEH